MEKPDYDLIHCPVCGSDDLEYGDNDYSLRSHSLSVTCLDCNSEWSEYFEYSDWEPLNLATGDKWTMKRLAREHLREKENEPLPGE